ncbi:nucleoside-diphosphate sugar epimerase/dehydratase [Methylocystis sp. B8]|uniref:polysaccharide biosynthesis protein n=1 Tax=Methylocystis sp. B8 TaxID=544938 RepID=UPI0010FDBA02|nr:nucleoside-diphosphate sugar epimerase/dehydratase [Methylocystis sp. B8]TLG77633.1 polysaccharide biosynthesis protein [Methylocystis sp. B8]
MLLNNLALPILALPRAAKRLVVAAVDFSLCVLTIWFAFYLRLGEFIELSGPSLWAVMASVLIALPIFAVFGLYRAIFRYSGWPALMTVTKAIGVYGLIFAAIFTAIGVQDVPRTIGLIQPILLLLSVGASRAVARFWLGGLYERQLKLATLPKVLIYGAGSAGRQLAAAMANSHEMRVIAFLDDDDRLQGHVVNGLPIHSPDDLSHLVETRDISTVLLALPSAGRKRRNEILNQMLHAKVSLRTLPSFSELAKGTITVSDLQDLDIDDLLGREPVMPDHALLEKDIIGKVVLVTGAGGSIGSELCRQIIQVGPVALLLVDHSEFALYQIHQELQAKLVGTAVKLVPLLASVRDERRTNEIMSTWRPHTVYHAAAYKHVPLVEHNPSEGVKNNVFGTLTAAKTAAAQGVANFVLISTDKAVRPTNIMGASKRLAEMVLQALAAASRNTKFSMVRFGNVLGSSGSVVPKFRQQIRDGGPITLTHPDITRYFMTIPEATQLVIQAGAMAIGGDVFVLDMGQSVRIMDLARRMIELSGLTVKDEMDPDGDIDIEVVGLRPGEKLYEELLIGDNPRPTLHPRIMKAHEDFLPWAVLEEKLNALEHALNVNDIDRIRLMLEQLVSGYTPEDEIVDWVHMEHEAGVADALDAATVPS